MSRGVRDYPQLAAAVAAVKKYAGKLAYINLLPDYTTLGANLSQLGTESYSDYLERFVKK